MKPCMHNYKIALVSPAHIPLNPEWIKAVDSFGIDVIIVDDSDGKVQFPERWIRLDYKNQQAILGDKYEYWQRFQRSSSCKNVGHYFAYKNGYDIIIGLDSDCIPYKDFVRQHVENLETESYRWENPLAGTGWFSRGFPYSERKAKTALSLGLWNNQLDLYGKDRVDNPDKSPRNLPLIRQKIAQNYIPLSGMNWATWRQNIPDLLFLPNHDDSMGKFRRHDDIWGGYIFQKKMQEKGERIVYGRPLVYHDTIVDAKADAEEEEAMMAHEDAFFDSINDGTPWPWVREALDFWKSLYE